MISIVTFWNTYTIIVLFIAIKFAYYPIIKNTCCTISFSWSILQVCVYSVCNDWIPSWNNKNVFTDGLVPKQGRSVLWMFWRERFDVCKFLLCCSEHHWLFDRVSEIFSQGPGRRFGNIYSRHCLVCYTNDLGPSSR